MLVVALLIRCEVPPNKFLDHSARITLISLAAAAVVLVLWSHATSPDSDFQGTVERIVVALVRAVFALFRQPIPSAPVLNVDANGGGAPPHGSRAAFATRIGWIIFGMILVIGLQLSYHLPMTQVLTAVRRWNSPMAPFLMAFGAAGPHRSGSGAPPAAAQSDGIKTCEAETCDTADGRGPPSFSLIVLFFFLLAVWMYGSWYPQGVPAPAAATVSEESQEESQEDVNDEEEDRRLNNEEFNEDEANEESREDVNDEEEDRGLNNEEFNEDEDNVRTEEEAENEDQDRGLLNNEQLPAVNEHNEEESARLRIRVEEPPERDLAAQPPAGRIRRFMRRHLCCAGP